MTAETVARDTPAGEPAIEVIPLSPAMAAEFRGADLSQPLSDAMFDAIRRAFLEHQILVFRDQQLTPKQQQAFSERFGELAGHVVDRFNMSEAPAVHILSNAINKEGRKIGADRAGRFWHSDLSYMERPSAATLLYGVQVPPEGGDTLFANMYTAYEALPEARRRWLEAQTAVHDYVRHYELFLSHREPLSEAEKAKTPPIEHPAVRTHPETGRKALYLSEGLTSHFVGMGQDESLKIIKELTAFATGPDFVYRHKWRNGDLVMWDNRCTMHQATPFPEDKYVRLMHRTTVLGYKPFLRT